MYLISELYGILGRLSAEFSIGVVTVIDQRSANSGMSFFLIDYVPNSPLLLELYVTPECQKPSLLGHFEY
jgi:hypothetical protein